MHFMTSLPITEEAVYGPCKKKLHWLVLVMSISQFTYNKLSSWRQRRKYIFMIVNGCCYFCNPDVLDFHKAWACSLGDYCQLLVCALSPYLVATSNWKLIDCLAGSVYLLQIYNANILCECFEAWTLLRGYIDCSRSSTLFLYCGSRY